jgi:DUF3047 family protein
MRNKKKIIQASSRITFALTVLLATFAFAAGDVIRVTIAKSPDSSLPEGWKLKNWSGTSEFQTVTTEIGPTIYMKSNSSSSALAKEINFNIKDYPYLNWRWKVTKTPPKGDVRARSTDDQAAQIYVVFPRWPAMVNSRLIGYIWDSNAQAGSYVASTKQSNTKYYIVKSGAKDLGKWFQEKRNVYADYKRWFHEEPPPVGSVSIMINSQNTGSSAESYIGDIYFTKN